MEMGCGLIFEFPHSFPNFLYQFIHTVFAVPKLKLAVATASKAFSRMIAGHRLAAPRGFQLVDRFVFDWGVCYSRHDGNAPQAHEDRCACGLEPVAGLDIFRLGDCVRLGI
jgi:hypothetical protein